MVLMTSEPLRRLDLTKPAAEFTVTPSLEEFKQMAAELLKALPTLKTVDQVQNGIKCLNLGYLGLKIVEKSDTILAVGVLEFTLGRAFKREVQIMLGD